MGSVFEEKAAVPEDGNDEKVVLPLLHTCYVLSPDRILSCHILSRISLRHVHKTIFFSDRKRMLPVQALTRKAAKEQEAAILPGNSWLPKTSYLLYNIVDFCM